MKTKKDKSIGIIGSGILGMSLAYYLRQNGYTNITLFEAQTNIGGLASAWNLGDIRWDKFYHVILLSDQYTRSMLD